MKKLLAIIVISLSCCSISEAGIVDWWKKLNRDTMYGCVYNDFGDDIQCLKFEWGGDTGKYWDEVQKQCSRATMHLSRQLGYEGQWTGCT